jgi:hypothetical protein
MSPPLPLPIDCDNNGSETSTDTDSDCRIRVQTLFQPQPISKPKRKSDEIDSIFNSSSEDSSSFDDEDQKLPAITEFSEELSNNNNTQKSITLDTGTANLNTPSPNKNSHTSPTVSAQTTRGSVVDEKTFQEMLLQDNAVKVFTNITVTCNLCNSTIKLRKKFYLFYWEKHKNNSSHINRQLNLDSEKRRRSKNGKLPARQSSVKMFMTPKHPGNTAMSEQSPLAVSILSRIPQATKICEGFLVSSMTGFVHLKDYLLCASLYSNPPPWYKIMAIGNSGRLGIFSINCPEGFPRMDKKEAFRCVSCTNLRQESQKIYKLKSSLLNRFQLFQAIDVVLARGSVSPAEIDRLKK